MLLAQSSWPEVKDYLQDCDGIIIPIGSIEQHGPNGLLGTDALCPEIIAGTLSSSTEFLIAPTFSVGIAQHHLAFPGTITLRPITMINAIMDWVDSLARHGFKRFYFLNGHGGNVPTINAAFAELYGRYSLAHEPAPFVLKLQNWWQLEGVAELSEKLYPDGLGRHATPAEISVTYAAYPESIKSVHIEPKIAPLGPVHDAADYRARFPDGRIGSNPSQSNPDDGKALIAASMRALIKDARGFFGSGKQAGFEVLENQ